MSPVTMGFVAGKRTHCERVVDGTATTPAKWECSSVKLGACMENLDTTFTHINNHHTYNPNYAAQASAWLTEASAILAAGHLASYQCSQGSNHYAQGKDLVEWYIASL